MAFSMLLRNSACTSRMFTQQAMRLATQPALLQKANSTALTNLTFKTNNSALLNAVRTFRTSPIRQAAEKTHDHSKLWVIERITSAALVPLLPVALLMPNKLFDSLLAVLITAHSFWGLEAMVVEYLRVLVVGPLVPKIAMVVVYSMTAITLGGLFYLTFNDIGMVQSFWKVWRNMKKPKETTRPTVTSVNIVSLGLEAIAVDYVRASIFGPFIPKVAIALVYLISFATLGGLFYVISHDIGIANSIRRLWAVKSESA